MERVLAVLAGQSGVEWAKRDQPSKTVRVRYDETRISSEDLVRIIDRTDLRLQAYRRWRAWLGRLTGGTIRDTATVVSDESA